jgi:hypothetical protein
MKEVLSVLTFGIGAVCFVVFFTVLKPHAFSAVAGPIKPEYCNAEGSEPLRGRVDSSCGYHAARDRR